LRAGGRLDQRRVGLDGLIHQEDCAILNAMSSTGARPVLSVMLIVADATAALNWYIEALGAEQLWTLTELLDSTSRAPSSSPRSCAG
jgi:hypothetical protein